MWNNIIYNEAPYQPTRLPNKRINAPSRVFHIKDGTDGQRGAFRRKYRDEYGSGNFLEARRRDSEYLANTTATFETLGPNIQKGLDNILETAKIEIHRSDNPLKRKPKYWNNLRAKGGEAAVKRQLDIDKAKALKQLYKGGALSRVAQAERFIRGEILSATDDGTGVSDFMKNFRAWQATSKLGGASLNSVFGDPATAMKTLDLQGWGFKEFVEHMGRVIQPAKNATRPGPAGSLWLWVASPEPNLQPPDYRELKTRHGH